MSSQAHSNDVLGRGIQHCWKRLCIHLRLQQWHILLWRWGCIHAGSRLADTSNSLKRQTPKLGSLIKSHNIDGGIYVPSSRPELPIVPVTWHGTIARGPNWIVLAGLSIVFHELWNRVSQDQSPATLDPSNDSAMSDRAGVF